NEGSRISGEEKATLLTSLSGLWTVCVEAVGQLWYLHVASYGVALLGIVALGRFLLAQRKADDAPRFRDPAWHAMLFLLLSAAAAVAVACIFLAKGTRVDHMIYGRYNEGVIAPLLAIGAWAVAR